MKIHNFNFLFNYTNISTMLIPSFIARNISTITFVQDTMEEMIMGYFKHASDHGLPQQARHKKNRARKL